MTSITCIIPWRHDPDAPERRRNLDFTAAWFTGYSEDVNPDMHVKLVDSGALTFDRGGSRNVGAAEATTDLLLFVDADTVVPWRQLTAGLNLIDKHPDRWVILYGENRYYNLTEAATEAVRAAGPFAPIPEPVGDQIEHTVTSWAGALLIPRAGFWAAGGYDARFGKLGWGYEDNAFQHALDTMWGPHLRAEGFAVHLWHPRGDADFSSPWIPESRNLANRYRRAAGNQRAMRRLIQEGQRSL